MPRPTEKHIAESSDKDSGAVCFSVVSEHIRRQNVAENEMNSNEKIAQRAEKGENVCTKVILWNWQEEH